MKKLVIFSGAQPSGNLTIGNYVGAIQQWVNMQYDYECLFCIVDLHSISMYDNCLQLSKISLDTVALYLACGIDPSNSIIFIQSHVPEHSQLNWLLNRYTYFGELNRMIQFKEKSKINRIGMNVGLFNYPVLMASDILLYRTNLVPVGEDQRQHLELVRNIAQRFNRMHGSVLVVPDIFVPTYGGKIMSLLNPYKKMSKTDYNSGNVITLLDDIDVIAEKISHAVTDTDQPPVICYDPINKPGISNLLVILSVFSNQSMVDLEIFFKNKTYVQLKNEVIKWVSLDLTKLQARYYIERSNEDRLRSILREGAHKARVRAEVTLKKIHKLIGFCDCI